jgi:hypothetical protein
MQFADDPVGYFGGDGSAISALDPAEAETLQQQALAHRLAQLLPHIPPLAALAEAQGLDASATLDEAPRLFFPHSLYKAYDPLWLLNRDFARMTRWLQAFTTCELTGGDVVIHPTVDAWLGWLQRENGLEVSTSSGTTGGPSLIARGRRELLARHQRMRRLLFADWFAHRGLPVDDMEFGLIWPAAASGLTALSKIPEGFRIEGLPSPDALVALYDEDLGIDYELYVMLARQAQARGEQALPAPTAYVEDKLAEAERRQRELPADLDDMLDRVEQFLTRRRVVLNGSPHNLAALAGRAIERGIVGIFAPNSFYDAIGGMKGRAAPENLEQKAQTFLGSKLHVEGYGMSEMNSGFVSCEGGRYHMPPWVVVWALDLANGWAPSPREGRQEGRGAFLDLASSTCWGGLVTADHIQVSYEPCECGRRSPSIARDIKRVQDDHRDVSFTPADVGAMRAAVETLLG